MDSKQAEQDLQVVKIGESPASGTWHLDQAHTSVEFVARHLVFAKVRGRFDSFDGSIQVKEDGTIQIDGTIDPATISTNQSMRDDHLRSGDFLEVERFPKITFSSTSVQGTGDESYEVVGDLTIKDVTNPVVLTAELYGVTTGTQGETRAAFSVKGEIDRFDFGLTWNAVIETGAAVVGRKIQIEVEGQAIFKN
ncbi:MAG: YceI family protein [Actinomycetota bacterium]|nr:YceI family protein [Actinomycetota bacterium]